LLAISLPNPVERNATRPNALRRGLPVLWGSDETTFPQSADTDGEAVTTSRLRPKPTPLERTFPYCLPLEPALEPLLAERLLLALAALGVPTEGSFPDGFANGSFRTDCCPSRSVPVRADRAITGPRPACLS